ncbi:hypothetical protein [Vibrio parahaemolyticus]|uniref:hypothetical protein n=1 Tax=Vibrio parahaemolyticus TaxID=670 RepID=UPI00193DF135|nr:hypothetical protein [Vibrio parahaemolyticus]MDS1997895.1 hypothetical protein [Vibrio parahaemolyticus]
MKPLGTNNAAENKLTTPKSAFGKLISQCRLPTKSLKPRELSTPENTSFQRVNRLLYQQTKRAEFQQKSSTQLTQKVAAPKNNSTVETMPILNFHHAS